MKAPAAKAFIQVTISTTQDDDALTSTVEDSFGGQPEEFCGLQL